MFVRRAAVDVGRAGVAIPVLIGPADRWQHAGNAGIAIPVLVGRARTDALYAGDAVPMLVRSAKRGAVRNAERAVEVQPCRAKHLMRCALDAVPIAVGRANRRRNIWNATMAVRMRAGLAGCRLSDDRRGNGGGSLNATIAAPGRSRIANRNAATGLRLVCEKRRGSEPFRSRTANPCTGLLRAAAGGQQRELGAFRT